MTARRSGETPPGQQAAVPSAELTALSYADTVSTPLWHSLALAHTMPLLVLSELTREARFDNNRSPGDAVTVVGHRRLGHRAADGGRRDADDAEAEFRGEFTKVGYRPHAADDRT